MSVEDECAGERQFLRERPETSEDSCLDFERQALDEEAVLFLDKLPNGRVQLTDVGTCETKVFNGGGIWHLVLRVGRSGWRRWNLS